MLLNFKKSLPKVHYLFPPKRFTTIEASSLPMSPFNLDCYSIVMNKFILTACLSLFLSCLSSLVHSQTTNLVQNPSFELGAICNGTTERIEKVEGWLPISGQPSYINTKCPLSKDSKSFVLGMRLPPASHGKVHTIQKFDQKTECQQGQLTAPLEAGQSYMVSLWVRLPIQFCQAPIDEVGVILSEMPLATSEDRRVMTEQGLALTTYNQQPISAQYEWQEVSTLYIAKGGEQYIAIGNFANNNINALKDRPEKTCTYLFMDAVTVRPFESVTLPTYSASEPLVKKQRFLLSEVSFEKNGPNLTTAASKALRPLIDQLKSSRSMQIVLSVHVERDMDFNAGMKLTQERAALLQRYLHDQGVDKKQVVVNGQGNTLPVVLNPKAGQMSNERVELVVEAI